MPLKLIELCQGLKLPNIKGINVSIQRLNDWDIAFGPQMDNLQSYLTGLVVD